MYFSTGTHANLINPEVGGVDKVYYSGYGDHVDDVLFGSGEGENVTSRVYEGVGKRQIMVKSIGVAFPSSESQVVFNLDDPRNFTDDGVHSHGACVRQIAAHIVVEDDVLDV